MLGRRPPHGDRNPRPDLRAGVRAEKLREKATAQIRGSRVGQRFMNRVARFGRESGKSFGPRKDCVDGAEHVGSRTE